MTITLRNDVREECSWVLLLLAPGLGAFCCAFARPKLSGPKFRFGETKRGVLKRLKKFAAQFPAEAVPGRHEVADGAAARTLGSVRPRLPNLNAAGCTNLPGLNQLPGGGPLHRIEGVASRTHPARLAATNARRCQGSRFHRGGAASKGRRLSHRDRRLSR